MSIQAETLESLSILCRLLSSLPSAAYMTGTGGKISFYNKHFETLAGGAPAQDVPSETFFAPFRFVGPAATPLPFRDTCLSRAVQERRDFHDQEVTLIRPDGARLELLIQVLMLWGDTEENVGALHILTDMTNRKLAVDSLRRSEERFRSLFNATGDAVFVHDLEARILDVNAAACKSLGYTREELLEMHVQDIEQAFPIDRLDEIWEQVQQLGGLKVDGHHRRKDGSVFPVEINIAPFPGPDGMTMCAAVRDISERKASEEAIRRSEELLRLYFDLGLMGMAISSPDKGWVQFNDRFCDMLGFSREEMAAMS
ncbi:MAG: PAS domain S-box protein [Candidatus Hydrogenedens sp.]|nr:PAS domain S-box protein [Candidatus Hydrogenedens sp.]